MRRIAVALSLVLVTAGLASCAESGVGAADAYKIGCPAIDSAAAGGSVAGKAAAAGLEQVKKSGQLDPEPERWVDAAIAVLGSNDPSKVSGETKKLIIDGCADNGYTLQNLK